MGRFFETEKKNIIMPDPSERVDFFVLNIVVFTGEKALEPRSSNR